MSESVRKTFQKTARMRGVDAAWADIEAEVERLRGLLEKNEGRVKEIVDEKLLRERDEAQQALATMERLDEVTTNELNRLKGQVDSAHDKLETAVDRADKAEAKEAAVKVAVRSVVMYLMEGTLTGDIKGDELLKRIDRLDAPPFVRLVARENIDPTRPNCKPMTLHHLGPDNMILSIEPLLADMKCGDGDTVLFVFPAKKK